MASDFRSTLDSLQRTLQEFTLFWREGHDVPAVTASLPKNQARNVRKLMADCLLGDARDNVSLVVTRAESG